MLVACPGCPGSTPSTAVRIPPSIYLLLSARCFPFIFALVFTSSHFTQQPPPSPSLRLPLRVTTRATCKHFAFSLDFQLACITVAVHNKTVNPPSFRLCSLIVVATHVCCCQAFCLLAGTEAGESPEKCSVGE